MKKKSFPTSNVSQTCLLPILKPFWSLFSCQRGTMVSNNSENDVKMALKSVQDQVRHTFEVGKLYFKWDSCSHNFFTICDFPIQFSIYTSCRIHHVFWAWEGQWPTCTQCSIHFNRLVSVCVELVVFAVFVGLQEITGRLFTDNRFVAIKGLCAFTRLKFGVAEQPLFSSISLLSPPSCALPEGEKPLHSSYGNACYGGSPTI